LFIPVVTQTFARYDSSHFQPAGAGDRLKPEVERGSAEPQEYGVTIPSSPRSGRQLFVIRHFITIEIGPITVARFAGRFDKSLPYLGFRAAALHLRLYAPPASAG